jgi:hypothetical protein
LVVGHCDLLRNYKRKDAKAAKSARQRRKEVRVIFVSYRCEWRIIDQAIIVKKEVNFGWSAGVLVSGSLWGLEVEGRIAEKVEGVDDIAQVWVFRRRILGEKKRLP